MSGQEDTEVSRRKYKSPYTPRNPIPTIAHYKEEKKGRLEEAGISGDGHGTAERTKEAYNQWRYGDEQHPQQNGHSVKQPYPAENKNQPEGAKPQDEQEDEDSRDAEANLSAQQDDDEEEKGIKDTSEAHITQQDPNERRKAMKKRKEDRAEREVTDPVTHLPVTIHDFTNEDLKQAPQNEPPDNVDTGVTGRERSDEALRKEQAEMEHTHEQMEQLFPPPHFEAARRKMAQIHQTSATVGLGVVVLILVILLVFERITRLGEHLESFLLKEESKGRMISSAALIAIGLGLGFFVVMGVRDWADNRMNDIWESEVWEAERQQGKKRAHSETPESAEWFNSLLASIWPLINPDLFTSLADTLEDVMQASLPRVVRMVSVDDIGQGSEALRILGVRWLPHGAATQSVTEDGKLKKDQNDSKQSDRNVPGEGQVESSEEYRQGNSKESKGNDNSKEQGQEDEQKNETIAEGMEAEEGDFVNLEIAFAYRARAEGKGLRNKAKNAHLYLAFYMPADIKLPVWVELRGIIGTMRVRAQLTPDPPFISLATLTFLGQPKVDLSCMPLTRKGLNLMDLPVISNFVQSSVDAAMAEYVAPKSLTLDLKEMLVGDDFKKDTSARGVLMVRIKRAFDFKEGDPGMLVKDGNADAYVSVGWAKFGKPVWSTRVILSDMNPHWEETAFVLVTPQELNVDERLRVQLWDSDRSTADDDLGRIEVDLKRIMHDERSNGKMWDRQDGLRALKADEGMPGKLEWGVGYFSKTRVLDEQLQKQKVFEDVKTMDDLKRKTEEESERKLREAKRDESSEIEQQKAQDMKEKQDQIIIATPPPSDYPSGILSIVIHQITGLELEAINKSQVMKNETADDESEEGGDLPSAYCIIMLNHQKVFKTRTKPKNAKPFFNAGCERFIRDWKKTEIHIAVRDARVHEDDALLGIVHLPLKDVMSERSQICDIFPIAGGIGFGRVRISMVFRAIQLQAPRELLGWEYGTLDIKPEIKGEVSEELKNCRIKVRTKLGRGKFHSGKPGTWSTQGGKNICLAVRKRYSSCLVVEFRSSGLVDKTPAFGVLWLKDIPDEEERTVKVPVFKGDMKRAESNALPEDEMGEKLGEIELTLTLWSGLSGYHLNLAKKDPNLGDVMEVLDAANDQDENDGINAGADTSSSSSFSSDSEQDDDSDSDISSRKAKFRQHQSSSSQSQDLAEHGKRGPLSQIKDYKQHSKQLHRRNRGLMQWKAPRTLQWAKNRVEHAERRAAGLFHHHQRDTGIETEV